jgi:hypothetical protein
LTVASAETDETTETATASGAIEVDDSPQDDLAQPASTKDPTVTP